MDVRQTIREFIRSNFYVGDGVRDDESLIEGGVLDSTGVLEVVAFVESEFRLRFRDEEIAPENLETIGRIADYVTRRLAEGSSEPSAPEWPGSSLAPSGLG